MVALTAGCLSSGWAAGPLANRVLAGSSDSIVEKNRLGQPMAQVVKSSTPKSPSPSGGAIQSWVFWSGVGLGTIGLLSGMLYYWRKPRLRLPPSASQGEPLAASSADRLPSEAREPVARFSADPKTDALPTALSTTPTTEAPLSTTTRLSKVSIVEALIGDLHSPDLTQRRQAIWELGQRGDSRAIQPLVDLLVEADSQQRSLILAALSEIGVRSLNPLNRALLLSIQDDSADVRKNAIRDLSRLCDWAVQLSQLMQYATSDPDPEVRETAQWALSQLNRLRSAGPEERSSHSSEPLSSTSDALPDGLNPSSSTHPHE